MKAVEAKARKKRKARENACEQAMIGSGLMVFSQSHSIAELHKHE